MSVQRSKGTEFENRVAKYLNEQTYEGKKVVVRNEFSSPLGDLSGTPFTIECKAHKSIQLAPAVEQSKKASIKTGKPPVVINKRPNKNVSEAYVTMDLETFAKILTLIGEQEIPL
jgi:hypothetical protein